VIVSDELRSRMIKPKNLEEGVWKENTYRGPARKVRPTSSMLIKKYKRQQQGKRGWSGLKRNRSPGFGSRMIGVGYLGSSDYHQRQVQRYMIQGGFELARVPRDTLGGEHVPWKNMENARERRSDTIVLCGGEASSTRE
jgi:hypothetical protein